MAWIINWAMNTHIHTQTHMRPRIIKRKSPWLCKTLALRNEKDLRNKTMSEPERPPENSQTSPQAQMVFTGLNGWRPRSPELQLSLLNQLPVQPPTTENTIRPARKFIQKAHWKGTMPWDAGERGLYAQCLCFVVQALMRGCWGPGAFETPYKGSLCGFLKLILSESPEANSVQLDYHSLLLNSAVFQCLLLNEFTVLTGSCWQSLSQPWNGQRSLLPRIVGNPRPLENKALLPLSQSPVSISHPFTPREYFARIMETWGSSVIQQLSHLAMRGLSSIQFPTIILN